ncbi:hypothetical protein TKK_0008863 [Trichogramma kaykai]|uniref:SAM domain-containing protein n=1 Tax=Trichogramma kaykai TaxID=54128 RepID=A0ABD2X3G8_9HYME
MQIETPQKTPTIPLLIHQSGNIINSSQTIIVPIVNSIHPSQISRQQLLLAPIIKCLPEELANSQNNHQVESNKFNVDGQIISNKVYSVLRESKFSNEANSTTKLHALSRMSLLNSPRNINNPNNMESIKINSKNPDSAVITPIIADKLIDTDKNHSQSTGDRRPKKQVFPKDVSDFKRSEMKNSLDLNNENNDLKYHKVCEEEVTLLKIVPNEENIMSSQHESSTYTPKLEVKVESMDTEEHSSKTYQSVGNKENSNAIPSPTHSNSGDNVFLVCLGCGCHGLRSEFVSYESCSPNCSEFIKVKKSKELQKKKSLDTSVRRKKQSKVPKEEIKTEDFESSSNESEKSAIKSVSEDESNASIISGPDQERQAMLEAKYPYLCGKQGFSWTKYLDYCKAKSAPIKLFKDPFPYEKNNFKPGMKLEGIDPGHPSNYCVLTVADVIGYRLRCHFDGYSDKYDFWVNADSADIFPVGWAEKNEKVLQFPKNMEDFSWSSYLKSCKALPAPKHLFNTNKTSNVPTGFRVGMKLEAVDRKDSSSVCVATVAGVMDNRILVHFDSWDDLYDYWADVSSPYIHPIGWCGHNGISLEPPNTYKDKVFSWNEYLKTENAVAAPARAFKQRPQCGFKRGMKLEAVDKRCPQFVRVASVIDVKDHLLKIRFDGWPENHAYWVDDDSPDIHPVGWCAKTGHPLEPPPLKHEDYLVKPECGIYGCKGLGNIKGPRFTKHNSASGCPYSPSNLHKYKGVIDRLATDDGPSHESNQTTKTDKTKAEKEDKKLNSQKTKVDNQKEKDSPNNNESFSKKKMRNGNLRKKRTSGNLDDTDLENPPKKPKSASTPIMSKKFRDDFGESIYNPKYPPRPVSPQLSIQHSKTLHNELQIPEGDPRRWSVEEVVQFVTSIPNCEDYENNIRANSIDGEALLLMTQDDFFTYLTPKIGPSVKLHKFIIHLREKALTM